MDSGFSDDRPTRGVAEPEQPASESPVMQRFQSCRWRRPAENGTPQHCGHRDVLPIAGTSGFAPEAWCPDCAHYKAKRTPRKPQPEREPYRW